MAAAMKARHDAHRPSTIKPMDYEYVAQQCMKIEGLGDCEILMENRKRIAAHMKMTGGKYSGHEHGGNCGVCGSVNAVYTVLFYHAKTNSYIRMGTDCADKCHMGNPEDFRTFRTQVQDALKRRAGKAKAQAILTEGGLDRVWTIYEATTASGFPGEQVDITGRQVPSSVPFEERTIFDIVGKLVQYGSISEKQTAFIAKLVSKIDTRAERARQRAEEDAKALPCPTGRLQVEGTVLSTKYQESPYGETLKMLVKTDAGWKVWGTVPSVLEIFTDGDVQRGLQHGDRIRFTATVTPSDKDDKFGFFKRPTKAERITS